MMVAMGSWGAGSALTNGLTAHFLLVFQSESNRITPLCEMKIRLSDVWQCCNMFSFLAGDDNILIVPVFPSFRWL